MLTTKEDKMNNRNPIARSFGAGINQSQVIDGHRPRIRRVKHRQREFERDDD